MGALDGSVKDYKFGQKNHWRRTVWNEVLSRTAGRERHQPILYLAGPQDIDRQIAKEKGVPDESMIAIDRSASNVASVRKSGGLAIKCDALDCLLSWPLDRPVAAVMLDLCCGLEQRVMYKIYLAIQRNPSIRQAVFMVNFMRGRDASTNSYREGIRQWRVSNMQMNGHVFDVSKHRAAQFVLATAFTRAAAVFDNNGSESVMKLEIQKAAGGSDYRSIVNFYLKRLVEVSRPSLWSYRSGVLVFDSSVFVPIQFEHAEVVEWTRRRGHSSRTIDSRMRPLLDRPTQRKISAALAVRTMRITGA